MYEDYLRRCQRHEVRLGSPYIYKHTVPPHIINFPTKDHWRSVSRLSDIVRGLEHLQKSIEDWGVTSLAVPPLGCGEGRLEWRVVGKTLYRHLMQLGIPVELYAPFGTPDAELRPEFLKDSAVAASSIGHRTNASATPGFRIEPGAFALVAILDGINRERYHWPVGRVAFQKIAYFATAIGIPTGLKHARGSYGPYAEGMKPLLSRLTNNGLLVERRLGRMLATTVGPTYEDAKTSYVEHLGAWREKIDAVCDLVVRMSTDGAEVAATAHFSANQLENSLGRRPTELEVLEYVLDWKRRRRVPLQEPDVALAIRRLNMLSWLDASPSPDLPVSEELMLG